MSKTLVFLLSIIFCVNIHSQQFGGTPPSQKWEQINTDTVRVIFPVGLDSQANRIAAIVHQLAKSNPFSLGDQLKKIDIVLQHQTIIPNAYVGLGPFRSEFYMTPPPNNFDQGSISWNDQLVLHEYRHVHQFNNFNHGLSRLMKTLFGEEGYAVAINASIPDWFYEGDAVYNETLLSPQGRGRIPQFLNAYPALWKAKKNYSWMKLRNGSMKDYVPNHYDLGFLLVNYGREKYGSDFWQKVTRDASAYKSLFYPFQAAIKKYGGVDYETFREEAFDFYRSKMKDDQAPKVEMVFPVKKNYVRSYFFPYASGDSLIYLKSSYRHLPGFYIKTGNKEHRIRTRDISTDQQFSYRNGKIVYAAYETDARWGWRDYSVIKLVDVETGRQTPLTKHSKYFTPDISFDGSRVAAVRNDSSGRSELHVINVADGKLLRSIHASDITVFTDPKFIDDDNIVTAVRLNNGKMTLALAEIETGNTIRLLPSSYNVIGYPSVGNGIIYFTASFNGNDDVYALRRTDNKLFRVTNGPLGNYFVNAGGGKITWSAFTAEGYQLMQMKQEDIAWEEVGTGIVEKFENRVTFNQPDANAGLLFSGIPGRQFPVSKYSKSTGLFNFHSWRPYYEDPIFTFSLYGQNVLNTLQTEIYYIYNQEEEEHGAGFTTTYGGLFPYLTAGTEYTFNRRSFNNPNRNWDQLDSRIGVIIPISKASGQTFKDFSFSNYVFLRNEFFKRPYADTFSNTNFLYLSHSINWIQQVQRAVQHIYPRFALSVNAGVRYPVTLYDGYQVYGATSVYMPGIISNHNLILSGAFQQRDTNLVLFSSRFASARGYLSYYGTNAGSRLTRLSADYHFPILHADWGFGNILYFQRFRGNIFYDHQKIYSNSKKNSAELRSIGAELFTDTKWWNQYPLTFGVRVSRLLDDDPLARLTKGSWVWEVVLPVAIIPR